jgi:predicted phosphodiesterase
VIRILSDLHWGHKASLIKDLDSLEGLLSEPDEFIFNGDTLEQKFENSPSHLNAPLPSIGQFENCVKSWKTKAHFITGNHDPKISQHHYCELNDGEILITHGDGIFKDIAPWSQNAQLLGDVAEKGLNHLQRNGDVSFYDFLQTIKDACIEENSRLKDYDPTVWGKLQIFLRQACPPTRVLKILDCWKATPQMAVNMAHRYGLSPKFLIIGHTHKPAIHSIEQTTVINTGSFLPWPGATAVDLTEKGIFVRKVLRGNRSFSIGKTIQQFELEIDLDSLRFPTPEPKSTSQASPQQLTV